MRNWHKGCVLVAIPRKNHWLYRNAGGEGRFGLSVIPDWKREGLFEVAVIEYFEGKPYELTYDTPFTRDVRTSMDEEDIERLQNELQMYEEGELFI